MEYQKLQREDDLSGALQFPDLRSKKTFYNKGYDLVVSRSKVLTKIIRGDPQKALSLALDQSAIDSMPPEFQPYLENWLYDYVDLEAIHVCYDPRHPAGLIKRHSILSTGERLRTWTFGQREKMPTVKGLSVWGVVWGLILRCPTSLIARKLHLLGKNFAFWRPTNPIQQRIRKEFFTSEIAKAERRAGKLHGFTIPYLRLLPVLGSPNIMTGSMILTAVFPHGKRPTRVHLLRAED